VAGSLPHETFDGRRFRYPNQIAIGDIGFPQRLVEAIRFLRFKTGRLQNYNTRRIVVMLVVIGLQRSSDQVVSVRAIYVGVQVSLIDVRPPAAQDCDTFRATGITAYLEAGGTLENAQAMAAHESPRTTKLYDRTGDEITLDEVERITIWVGDGRLRWRNAGINRTLADTTPLALIAFIVAAAFYAYRGHLLQRRRTIASLPSGDKIIAVEATLKSLNRFRIDTTGLKNPQKVELALAQIRAQAQRFLIGSVVVCVLAIVAAIISVASLPLLQQTGSPANIASNVHSRVPETSSETPWKPRNVNGRVQTSVPNEYIYIT
jgi:hypothetical protein